MFDTHTYFLFLATALILVLAPGPDTVLVLSRTLSEGRSAGIVTLLGTQVGNIIHAVFAGVGVSTVILLFPPLFYVFKLIGLIYLIYLAFVSWNAPVRINADANEPSGKNTWRCFTHGLTNNLVNPKVVIFFVALFPQFVRPGGLLALQSFLLGATLAVMAIVWMGIIVVTVGHFRGSLVSNPTFLKVTNRLAAFAFVGLACRLALQDRR